MTRGDEEESGEDQRPVEVEPDDITGRSAVPVNSDHPAVWLLVPQTDTLQSIQDHRLVESV